MRQNPWFRRSLVLCLAVLAWSAEPDAMARDKPRNPGQVAVGNGEPSVAKRYDELVTKARDLEYADLLRQLAIGPPAVRKLSFEPTDARYFSEVDRACPRWCSIRFSSTGTNSSVRCRAAST